MLGRFALAWDEFQAKMAERFKTLLHSGEFSDVTLVAKDSTRLKVHKVILASGSGFFKDIMSQMDNHPNALIYMIGMDTTHLTGTAARRECHVSGYQKSRHRELSQTGPPATPR